MLQRLVGLQEREGAGAWRRGLGLRLGGEGGEERGGLVNLLAGHEARELVAAAGAGGVTRGERAGITRAVQGSEEITGKQPTIWLYLLHSSCWSGLTAPSLHLRSNRL